MSHDFKKLNNVKHPAFLQQKRSTILLVSFSKESATLPPEQQFVELRREELVQE